MHPERFLQHPSVLRPSEIHLGLRRVPLLTLTTAGEVDARRACHVDVCALSGAVATATHAPLLGHWGCIKDELVHLLREARVIACDEAAL
eukprot:8799396-Alexandrium_andersonii.AAC.1